MARRTYARISAPAGRTERQAGAASGGRTGGLPTMAGAPVGAGGAAHVLELQRLAGNQAVQRALTVARDAGRPEPCDMPQLACTAKAKRASKKALKASKPVKVSQGGGAEVWQQSGTLTVTFKTTVTIRLAKVPPGLPKCAAEKVRSLIETKLEPHEQDHKARFLTKDPSHAYNGTVTKQVSAVGDTPGGVQQALIAKVDDEANTEFEARQDRNEAHAVTAIDPFSEIADVTSCPECKPPGN